ncbi:MAG TPA: glutamate formimidoyltransferase [Chroococcales cyanobacterium]
MRLVECVPNFSEGRKQDVIEAIAAAIREVDGVSLLDVDPGASTNRTVVTFVGDPDSAVEAAFKAIASAERLIDMRQHKGEHPRMGATDVCPFVPVAGVTMQDCVKLAERLGERVGSELGIPVYLYAEAAKSNDRVSLADIRKGEYEALPAKMTDPSFVPDFGPQQFNASAGATVIGARPFLIAYNVNLNTRSKKLANEIAFNIREAGRNKKNEKGETVKDAAGNAVKQPGTLKSVRAVGWYVEEYERAQVSINLVNIAETSLHQAFDECCKQAEALGLRVTGSEIVGLVPLSSMLEAGRHYLAKQGRSTGVSEAELVTVAVQSLGLSDLKPFQPKEKIIEYRIRQSEKALRQMPVSAFLDELASESAAPGGGSVAALCGSLSAGLTAMVANLTFEKKGFEDSRALMDQTGSRAQSLKQKLMLAIDEDMNAFNAIIDARRLPKGTEKEKQERQKAIDEANKLATTVPLQVLEQTPELLEIARLVVQKGNPNSLSDAGVAVLTALSAAEAAYFNVLINLKGMEDDPAGGAGAFVKESRAEAEKIIEIVRKEAEKLRLDVLSRL